MNSRRPPAAARRSIIAPSPDFPEKETTFCAGARLALCALAFALGCTTGSAASDSAAATEESDEPSSQIEYNSDSEETPDTDESTDSEIATPDTDDGPYARSISITHVEANQGSATFLVERGTVVPPGDRNVGLVMGRPLLLRAYWERGAGFRNRNITAALHLHFPDATVVRTAFARQSIPRSRARVPSGRRCSFRR